MRGANPNGSSYIANSSYVVKGTLVRSLDLGAATRSSPAIVNGVLYIGGDFKVTAIDVGLEETLWEIPTTGPVHGTPAVAGDKLYLPLLDKRVLALDLETGSVEWEFKADSPLLGSAVVDGGIVYSGSQNGQVYALDAESGREIWKLDTGSSAMQAPAVYRGKIVAGSSAGGIFVQNARTGDKRLRIRTGSVLVTPPVVGNDQIYILSDGDLLAFDANTRELPGEYPLRLVWAQLWIWQLPVPQPPAQPGFNMMLADIPDSERLLHSDPEKLLTANEGVRKDVHQRYGLDATVSDDTERKLLAEHLARAEAIVAANPIDKDALNTILKAGGMESTGLRLLSSESPVAKAVGILLTAEGTAGQAYNCYDRYIAEQTVAEIAKEITGSACMIEQVGKVPKHQIDTSKVRALGMKFGGTRRLEQTVHELLEA
ncbi:MAG: PQQ-like beta-propeller repeat protein [Planctomycetes bacterium]|nr:PQQ-like beta-propeller repeat protein [Planctomycetota bacterium]